MSLLIVDNVGVAMGTWRFASIHANESGGIAKHVLFISGSFRRRCSLQMVECVAMAKKHEMLTMACLVRSASQTVVETTSPHYQSVGEERLMSTFVALSERSGRAILVASVRTSYVRSFRSF